MTSNLPRGSQANRRAADGQNPFRTTWDPWLQPLFVDMYRGSHQKPGFSLVVQDFDLSRSPALFLLGLYRVVPLDTYYIQ